MIGAGEFKGISHVITMADKTQQLLLDEKPRRRGRCRW
jgi:hypothetical protein